MGTAHWHHLVNGVEPFGVGVTRSVLVKNTTEYCLPYLLNNPEHDSEMCSWPTLRIRIWSGSFMESSTRDYWKYLDKFSGSSESLSSRSPQHSHSSSVSLKVSILINNCKVPPEMLSLKFLCCQSKFLGWVSDLLNTDCKVGAISIELCSSEAVNWSFPFPAAHRWLWSSVWEKSFIDRLLLYLRTWYWNIKTVFLVPGEDVLKIVKRDPFTHINYYLRLYVK